MIRDGEVLKIALYLCDWETESSEKNKQKSFWWTDY